MVTVLRGVCFEDGGREGEDFYHVEDGLHYVISSFNGDASKAVLKCLLHDTMKCPGSAIWEDGCGLRHTYGHNHLPSPLFPSEFRLKQSILNRIRNGEYTSFAELHRQESSRFGRAVQARVSLDKLFPEMVFARASILDEAPSTLLEVGQILSNPPYNVMAMSVDGQDGIFCTYVHADDGTLSLLFATERMMRYLARVTYVFCEGSGLMPAMAGQNHIFTLLTTFKGYVVPVLYCVLESNTLGAYRSILREVKKISPHFSPKYVMTTYDDSMKEAWQREYPTSICVAKSLYHFIGATMEFAMKSGLGPLMSNNRDVRRLVSLCGAIVLAPHHFMHPALVAIASDARNSPNYSDLRPLFHYIWSFWLSGRRYEAGDVSLSGSTLSSTNTFEVFHRILADEKVFLCKNIFHLTGILAKLEDKAYKDVESLLNGRRPAPEMKSFSLASNVDITMWTKDLFEGRIDILKFLELAVKFISPMCDLFGGFVGKDV